MLRLRVLGRAAVESARGPLDGVADKAGHRLTQMLYALRRELEADDLFLGSADLGLNPERITSDVAEFRAARQDGELQLAVSLYRGPFLDGFYLRDAPEFEHWVENERAGFAREYAEGLETLAAEAALQGDHRRAAEWWRDYLRAAFQLADFQPGGPDLGSAERTPEVPRAPREAPAGLLRTSRGLRYTRSSPGMGPPGWCV